MQVFEKLSVTLCLAVLVGCGGGSPSTQDVAPVAATAPPATQKLTINGAVTDDPIDSARVSFRVGERHFEATIDSDVSGIFSVEIEYDSLDDIVYGEALRQASGIHFVGDVMTVRDLLARSRDGQVDDARITNVTTAKFVLASHSTDDGVIDSYDEFESAVDGVDAEQLLNVGAAIKAVVEAIDGTTLPSATATTLELAEAIVDGSSSFISDLNVTSPGTMDAAITKLLSDGYATVDFTAAAVPGVYMSTSSPVAYALFADGSGLINYFDDRDIERIRNWSINEDGDLVLSYAATATKIDVLQQLSASRDALQMNQRRETSAEESVTYDVANFRRFRFDGRFDAAAITGTYTNSDGSGPDFELGTDGQGFFLDASGTPAGDFSWQLAGDGRLVLDVGADLRRTLSILGATNGELRVLSIDTRTSGAVQGMLVQSYSRG